MHVADATVYVVDPDPAMRASLEAVIHRAGWAHECVADAAVLLTQPPPCTASCVVLNLGAADLTDFDQLRRLAAGRKETPIIAIAERGDVPTTVQAMKAGAVEFLTTPVRDDALLPAIDYALDASRGLLDESAQERELRRRYDSLSDRERAVMDRVVSGAPNKCIGSALGIAEVTVKAHRGRVMRKMQAGSLAELVTMALRLELPTVHV